MENACAELDLEYAERSSAGTSTSEANTFVKYVAALKKRETMKLSLATDEHKAIMLEQLVTYLSLQLPSNTTSFTTLRKEASKARLRVTTVVHNGKYTRL